VRTTLNIPEDLFTAVKVQAARRGETVTSLVEEPMGRLLPEGEASRQSVLQLSECRGCLKPAGTGTWGPSSKDDALTARALS
jgi:hypothetical protein